MPKCYNAPTGFELNPAGMAKECQGLRRWKSTHAPRLEALEGLLSLAQREAAQGKETRETIASERAANACLTAEIEAAQKQIDMMREALLKCKTCALPTEVRDVVNAALRHNAKMISG